MLLIILYLLSVLASYLFIRENVRKQVEQKHQLVLEEIMILIIMSVIPVLNLVFSIRLFRNHKYDVASLVETFFFIK